MYLAHTDKIPDVQDKKPHDRPWNILIVDDEAGVRKSLSSYLELLEDFKVHEAENAYDAINMLHQMERVDGVLVDINMPGMDGIEFVSRVKERDRTIVAIIITGFPSIQIIVDAMRAGASDFLVKPFKLEQFKMAMERLAHERKILIENEFLTHEVKAKKALEKVNRQLEQKVREQAVLFTISNALSQVKSTRELYQRVVSLACTLTDAQRSHFWVVNQETGKLVLMGAQGPHNPEMEEVDLADDSFAAVKVVRESLPVLILGRRHVSGHKSLAGASGDEIFVPFNIRKEVFGVLSVDSPREGKEFGEESLFLLHLLAERASLTVENLLLYESVNLNLHATLKALVRSLEAKDPYTKEHSQRVTDLAVKTAEVLGCSSEELGSLRFAGPLHDIGKIGIRDQILMKPGRLTREEYEIIKAHPVIGEEIVGNLGLLPVEKWIVRHHHERWDGKGYPDGLAGTDIPWLSRILAVADTYDAITSRRPYRAPRNVNQALEEIRRCSGTQLDPAVAEAFQTVIKVGQGEGGKDR